MKNKIESLNGSIDMCYRLQKGEILKFGENVEGALKFSVSIKDGAHNNINNVLIQLFDEREKLQERVNRMGG